MTRRLSPPTPHGRPLIRFKPWLPRYVIEPNVTGGVRYVDTVPLPDAPCPPCPLCNSTATRIADEFDDPETWWRCENVDECASWDMDMPEYSEGYYVMSQVEELEECAVLKDRPNV